MTPEGRDTLREVFLLEGPHPPKALALIGTKGQIIARVPIGPHDWSRSGEVMECRKPFENLSTDAWSVAAVALMAGPPFFVQALRAAPVRVEVGQQAVFSLRAP